MAWLLACAVATAITTVLVTDWWADREPDRLGYPGDEEMPQHFGGQMLWPLSGMFRGSPRE